MSLSIDGGLGVAGRVVLKPRKALPFYGRHPWVLASAVDRVEPVGIEREHLLDLDGQEVELVNEKRKFIARGIYNSKSRICVRLYTWDAEEALDEAFFRRRIEEAAALRRKIGYHDDAEGAESAARLIFSESDGISGLVVDRYGEYLVVQPTALGIARRLEMVVGVLQEVVKPKGIVLKLDDAMAALEGIKNPVRAEERFSEASLTAMPFADGHIWGELPEGSLTIREHGIPYEVDLRGGQKTGFYLDQRENRLAAARYLAGRRVLDMFCYTGGFALTAASRGAKDVLGIDGSKKAIAQARKNAELSGLQNVQFEVGDGFKTLDRLVEEGEKFEAVILDPPKFARGRGGANQALMAYHRLNRTAIELLVRGGILLTCSCTGGVSREDFLLMLSGVAQKSRREVRILESRGAAADHPVSATCLETEYLKCIICEIL